MYRKAALVAAALLLAFAACVDEAPTVQPPGEEIIIDENPPGDEFLHFEGIYPEDPNPLLLIFADAPVDTDLIILFSKPVETATITSTNIQIVPATPSFNVSYFAGDAVSGYKGVRIDLTNGGTNLLPFNTTYNVTINKDKVTGVFALDGNYLYQSDTYQYQFTTGTDTSADLDPRVIAVTRYPAPLATGICCVIPYVEVTFSKPVGFVTATSFTINPASGVWEPLDSLGNPWLLANYDNTWKLPLNPLNYSTTYTVNLTAAITDGSNPLVLDGNQTWSFTTELNPVVGAQGIGSVWVTGISASQATVYFTTNMPVATNLCSVDFGTSTAYSSNQVGAEATAATIHSITINLLTQATKYWYRINVPTLAPQSTDPVTGAILAFITEDNTALSDDDPVSDTASDKSGLIVLQHHNRFSFDGSSYAFWKDTGDNNIYGYYFDTNNPPTPDLWGADGVSVDSNNRDSVKAFADFFGRVIVLLYDSTVDTNPVYVKMVYDNAGSIAFDSAWAADAGANGIPIGTGTNPAAVLIWGAQGNNNVDGGFVTKLFPVPTTTGPSTTDMSYLSWAAGSYFFDFHQNIGSPPSGSILYRRSDHQVSTVTNTSDYSRVRMQANNNFITPGDLYIIADVGSTDTFTARDHTTRKNIFPSPYNNSLDDVYSDHSYSPGIAGYNDVLYDGTNYGRIHNTNLTLISPASWLTGGSESTWQRLIDVSNNFSGVAVDDWVTDGSLWAQVTIKNSSVELALDSDIMFWGENYVIYENAPIDTRFASATSPNRLVDTVGPHSNWTLTVADGDLVWNSTTSNYTTVNGPPPDDDTLNLNADIFVAGDGYEIYKRITSGTAYRDGYVVDVDASWSGLVNHLVLRDGVSRALVTSVSSSGHILGLSSPIFTGATNWAYDIYDDFCWTHTTEQSFYHIDVDWDIGVSSGDTITIYNRLRDGTADAPPTNPLYDNWVDFSAYSVGVGDIVIHENNMTRTTVNDITYYAYGALGLLVDIGIVDNQQYWILDGDPVIDADLLEWGDISGVAGNVLNDSANYQATFVTQGVAKGDLVYNINRNTYAVVVTVSSQTQLQLNKDVAAMGWIASDIYMVFSSDEPLIETGYCTNDPGGNLFDDANAEFNSVNSPVQVGDIVHNNTAGVDGYVTAVNSATQLTLNADIMSFGDRYVIMQPRILFVYERGGDIYGRVVRLRDGSDYQGFGEIDICTAAGTQSNVHVVERGFRGSFNGGAFVVYESSDGNIYAKLVDGDGIVPGGAGLGTSIGSGTIIDVISESWDMFYVLYKSGTDVYLRSINNALGVNWTRTFVNADDAAMMLSPSYYITVAYSMGSQVFVQQFDWNNVVTMAASTVVGVVPYAYYSNLSITASPGTNGAIVSWIDERYFASLGFVVMAQAVDGTGSRQWNADSSGADWDGILIGIPGTWEASDAYLKALFYNDGDGFPWDGLFLWYDYRNLLPSTRTDIYYDTRIN